LWSNERIHELVERYYESVVDQVKPEWLMTRVRDDYEARIAALMQRVAMAWVPVDDGLLPEENKMLTRVMDDGRRIVQADSILTTRISGSVFLPDGFAVCKRTTAQDSTTAQEVEGNE
jgi:hypothetical protein